MALIHSLQLIRSDWISMPGHLIDLLLVEDNPGDVRLAQEALRDYHIQNTLHVVTDGEEAMAYLRKEGKYASSIAPDMILLDISLPKLDGMEVLAELHLDPVLKDIPVVILTSSKLDEQLLKQHGIAADCYIAKPLTVESYMEAVKCFPHIGLSLVSLRPPPTTPTLAAE